MCLFLPIEMKFNTCKIFSLKTQEIQENNISWHKNWLQSNLKCCYVTYSKTSWNQKKISHSNHPVHIDFCVKCKILKKTTKF